MNPQNGLSLNALHDKAFETGLITILPNFKIKVSSIVKKEKSETVNSYFLRYDGQQILMPKRFIPDKEFLEYHNDERFKK
jgi:putative restriction endonuclease